jgi:hypothetical protein
LRRTPPGTAVRRIGLGLALGSLLLRPAIARAQEVGTLRDPTRDGYGLSYWGEIPPPADSTTAPLANRRMPLWEGILVWPYRVVAFPFRLVGDGVVAAVAAVDESPFLSQLFSLQARALTVSPEVNVGGLSGFGLGIAIQRDSLSSDDHQLRFRVSGSSQGDARITLGTRFALGSRGRLTLGGGFRDHANTRFFGIGPDAAEDDESLYREVQAWVGAIYGRRLTDDLTVAGVVEFTSARADEPRGDFAPPLSERFAGSLPPGWEETTTGVLGGITLEHDDTDGAARPNRGGRRIVHAAYLHSLADRWASHWNFRLEAQQFTRLWFPSTVLALRGVLTWLEPVGDAPIPFQRLMHNNDPDLFRGFPDRRWRDNGLLLLTAEYRWPMWAYGRADGPGLDAYFLTDVGQVFPGISAIRTDDFTVSYGGGFRLVSGQGFLLRLEYARSAEGGIWRLQSHQTFQFVRGLFHGRDAVPAR